MDTDHGGAARYRFPCIMHNARCTMHHARASLRPKPWLSAQRNRACSSVFLSLFFFAGGSHPDFARHQPGLFTALPERDGSAKPRTSSRFAFVRPASHRFGSAHPLRKWPWLCPRCTAIPSSIGGHSTQSWRWLMSDDLCLPKLGEQGTNHPKPTKNQNKDKNNRKSS